MLERMLKETKGEEIFRYMGNSYTISFFLDHFQNKIRFMEPKQLVHGDCLVILGGRTEYLEKYQEVIFDLQDMELDIYIYDHPGQGGSYRPLQDPLKGHIEDFSDYVEVLQKFLQRIVANADHRRVLILSFSMGATITLLHQLRYPGSIQAAILCCPMLAINSFPLPGRMLGWLTDLAVAVGLKEFFLPFGKEYRRAIWLNNPHTSSKTRFQLCKQIEKKNRHLVLRSPTFGWLKEAQKAMIKVQEGAEYITIPLLVMQSGGDGVVRREDQEFFCSRAADCSFYCIDGAKHELLMEKDGMRDQAMEYIRTFLLQQGIKQRNSNEDHHSAWNGKFTRN